MVEQSSALVGSYRPTKSDYDRNTRLGHQPGHFDCPLCFSLLMDIWECPNCAARACEECLINFSQTKKQALSGNDKAQKNFTCSVCHQVQRMKPVNRIMRALLDTEILFDCDKCQRFWLYKDFKQHSLRGQCKPDPSAVNHKDKIRIPVSMEQMKAKNDEASLRKDSMSQQPMLIKKFSNSFPLAKPLEKVYILERDSKMAYTFFMHNKTIMKRAVNIENKFEHNFQYCQTESNRLFLIGGGDINRQQPSLKQCFELVDSGEPVIDCIPRDELKYGRHGHSICCLKDKFLVVTGSRVETDQAYNRCEQYNIDLDLWYDMPSLNVGRHYHASCTFSGQFVYVFCGIAHEGKKYCNSIEMYDNQTRKPWTLINIETISFPERQGCGVSQINEKEIIVFGGFSGKFIRDSYLFNVKDNTIKRTAQAPAWDLFAYQMPTILDKPTGTIVTADWTNKKIFQYEYEGQFTILKDFKAGR